MKFDRRLTDEIYTSDTVRLGKNAFQAMQETIYHNGGVGTISRCIGRDDFASFGFKENFYLDRISMRFKKQRRDILL